MLWRLSVVRSMSVPSVDWFSYNHTISRIQHGISLILSHTPHAYYPTHTHTYTQYSVESGEGDLGPGGRLSIGEYPGGDGRGAQMGGSKISPHVFLLGISADTREIFVFRNYLFYHKFIYRFLSPFFCTSHEHVFPRVSHGQRVVLSPPCVAHKRET